MVRVLHSCLVLKNRAPVSPGPYSCQEAECRFGGGVGGIRDCVVGGEGGAGMGIRGLGGQTPKCEVAGSRYFVSWAMGTLGSLLPCSPLQDALAGGHQQHD